MDNHKIVSPSELIQSTLPDWIRSQEQVITDGQQVVFEGTTPTLRTRYRSENHRNFINFMEKSAEAQERIGFSQDLLQNLLKYRDFDTYAKSIVQYNFLKLGEDEVLSAEEEEVITLVDGYGFPEANGIISIGDEIILYRTREGNKLYNLQRGASGTTMIPTFRDTGEYKRTEPQTHQPGTEVVNLSVLFLVSMLDTIHNTYATNIDASRVVPEVNRSSLLQNIKDFFRAKGTKLGIKALFKFLFAEPDVDVFYPGDRMIKPSMSTWSEAVLLRTVPIPLPFQDPEDKELDPDEFIGSRIEYRSYLDDKLYAEGVCEYVSEYTFEDEIQYELSINKDDIKGDFFSNPNTELTRYLFGGATNTPFRDVNTVTVQSTLGFPERGVIFIDMEAIFYNRKSPNQFLDCTRGYMGVMRPHNVNSKVYGPYYIEMKTHLKGQDFVSRSWPKGLVNSIDIPDSGLLSVSSDKVNLGLPGMLDPREQILCTIKNDDVFDVFGYPPDKLVGVADHTAVRISGHDPYVKFGNKSLDENLTFTFDENYDDLLVSQDQRQVADGNLVIVADRTFGVDSIYFNNRHVYVSSSGFPSFTFGDFNTDNVTDECLVGRELRDDNFIAVIPRRDEIKENTELEYKGTDVIGIFKDGVRAYSNVAPRRVTQGTIGSFNIINPGKDYVTPTILVDDRDDIATLEVDPEDGRITKVNIVGANEFTDNPEVEVTSGKGATFVATFDNYGRIKSVHTLRKGSYYYDAPIIQAVDATGKGKGALLKCEVVNGRINRVDVVNPGIDYDSKATTIVAMPIGANADIEAITQYYEFNRPGEIINNTCGRTFDIGNGYLYERHDGVLRTNYGYTVNPTDLTKDDIGIGHSELIGFAFDGNPIYGPYGYANNYDASGGVERQVSAYVQLESRRTIKPARSNIVGTNPPLVSDYPMGTFVQDFVYAPNEVYPSDTLPGYLSNEEETFLNTEVDKFIEIETKDSSGPQYPNNLLDENNGKVCNTPEYPVQLYPKGVYCYFITIDEQGEPAFPYIMGKTFHSLPMPQELDENFDISKLERLRDLSALRDAQDIKLELSSVSEGSVDHVVIQDNETPSRMVGDVLYIDNTDTGGAGAQAVVTAISGKPIKLARGSKISYQIIPHLQVIGLEGNVDSDGRAHNFTLNTDYVVDTGTARFKVIRYMQKSAQLVVETLSYDIPQEGQVIYDQKGRRIVLGEVTDMRTPEDHTTLWFDNIDDLKVGDVLELTSQEKIKVLKIGANKEIKVNRGYESEALMIGLRFTADQIGNYYFTITTSEDHGLRGGDIIKTHHIASQLEGEYPILLSGTRSFRFFVDTLMPQINGLTYSTQANHVTGFVGAVELTSPGYGYSTLPYVKGVYNRYIDRAVVTPIMSGGKITEFRVDSGGGRYTPGAVAVIADYTNSGSGAVAEVIIGNGVVTDVLVTEGGSGYREPVVYIVQEEGKYILGTDTIGKINSMKVINPGRDVNFEGLARPEVITPTRVVVKYQDPQMKLFPGDEIFQGAPTLMTATARVLEYDIDRQMATLGPVTGFLDEREKIYSLSGVVADVVTEGDSHCMIQVHASSRPEGRFVDDTSLLSEQYAVIQDSYRYQWFSYVIASDVQATEYDTFVDKIIHPSGFVRFGDLTLRTSVASPFFSGRDDDSGIVVNDFDVCTSNVLIVGQKSDLPILTSDEKQILIYDNYCQPDVLCLVLDGGVAGTPLYLHNENCSNAIGEPEAYKHDSGPADAIYCDSNMQLEVEPDYVQDLIINN